MVENSLDLLKFEHDFAGFVYNLCQVGWLGFWRRKPATRPTGVGPWTRKPETVQREHRFGFGRVGRVGRVPGWVGHPY